VSQLNYALGEYKEENDKNSWYRKRKAGKLEGQKRLE
jgi:hypothetical protein